MWVFIVDNQPPAHQGMKALADAWYHLNHALQPPERGVTTIYNRIGESFACLYTGLTMLIGSVLIFYRQAAAAHRCNLAGLATQ
ncbi:MAG: hypothetical protein ABSF99_11235 [Anaerolineales bacterium]